VTILEQIGSPAKLKDLSLDEMRQLAAEIRTRIIDTVSVNGGHLASSLGVVELTIALHRVLDAPEDAIIWDVGHQAYAHKLLTGRSPQFDSLRRYKGLSGFPKRAESIYDAFGAGHASTSISAALGMAAARDALGGTEKVVAVIGDGSLTGGLAFEGLNLAGHLQKDLIVVLNDNEMSISPNVGAVASFLSREMTSARIVRLRSTTRRFLEAIPRVGTRLVKILQRAEGSLKGFLTPGQLFETFGFSYVGPLDGHRLKELIETLENVKRIRGPVLLHVLTKKGAGYGFAEESPARFHGVGPFDRTTGRRKEGGGTRSYTTVFGRTLVEMAEKDDRIVAITAAMAEGTGLQEFARRFPSRFYDVGIAESHGVTFAAGLSCRGLRPVVALYSTFLQRAYDNIVHDVCLQNLPVIFAVDRAGLVGEDGPTHHGVFDLSYLRHIPNLVLMAPRDGQELRRGMATALGHDGPFALRYPRACAGEMPEGALPPPVAIGTGETLRTGSDGSIFAVGSMVGAALLAAERLETEGIRLGVVDARFIKPLDRRLLCGEARRTGLVVTAEENALDGGFGSAVLDALQDEGLSPKVLRIGIPDRFIEHGSRDELRAASGLDVDGMVRQIRDFVLAGASAASREAVPRLRTVPR
jgi:1-deoxy-D-xylulose-5-phosphate synthase